MLLAGVALAMSGCAPPAPTIAASASPPTATPLVIGETFHLDSRVLGERRVINVYLPPGYAEGTTRYPVLYLLDGGIKEDFPHITGLIDVSIKNEVIRPFVVVGIENTERRRDLVGPTTVAEEQQAAPHAGGADRFRQFLRAELKPAVAARYRVTPESALIGESLAGLFVVETLLAAPDLFDTYIAVDPSTWWNHQAVVRGAAERLRAWTTTAAGAAGSTAVPPGVARGDEARSRTLYVATADAPEMKAGAEILAAAIRDVQPPGLAWHYQPLPEEHHGTIFPVAALKAFRALFASRPTSGSQSE
ncbi:MAG TPA: alpha/beta hydrolase-fold protein [Kofleriaceae bacterium]|nr:alpha/beta hydrolase-fold protein [Kofleriaceae bacterium]